MKNSLIIFCLFLLFGCEEEKYITPSEYKYKSLVLDSSYTRDKRLLEIKMFELLSNKKMVFKYHFYDEDTKIFIDTIFYSPNSEKIAFLVITQISNLKYYEDSPEFLKKEHPSNEFTYEGECFLAVRKNNNWCLEWFRFQHFIGFEDFYDLRKSQRAKYLSFLSRDDRYYNLDDKRFWTLDMWNETIEDCE